MCILFTTDNFQTANTLLILAPLRTPPSLPQAWQLTYINTLKPILQPFSVPTTKSGNSSTISNAPLMIVPLPNPHHLSEFDFTLFELPDLAASSLRTHTETLLKPYSRIVSPYHSTGDVLLGSVHSFGGNSPVPPLQLQNIGKYKITVAPTLADLQTRAPWSKYAIDPLTLHRILCDVQSRYPTNTAFLIAQTTSNSVDQAGFSVLYRDARPTNAFFPTSHEPSASGASPYMDVTLVALGAIIHPLSLLPPEDYFPLQFRKEGNTLLPKKSGVVLRGDDTICRGIPSRWHSVAMIIKELPIRGASGIHENKFVEHERVRLVTAWKLSGIFDNADVVGRKATLEDETVVENLYADLGSWMAHREVTRNVTFKGLFGGSKDFGFKQNTRLAKIDLVLELLVRQLADPGLHDRISDVPNIRTGEKRACGPVAYVNLDLDDVDLDEETYGEKHMRARMVTPQKQKMAQDTLGSSYIRISARVGTIETLDMRTVRDFQDDKP